MKAAQYWADYLKVRGVQRVFGLPGTESLELVEATRRAGLEFCLAHHEATTAFIAAMYGHLTGVPGVCLATRGPGAMNLTSGIAAAFLDRMPLLAVTGDHAQDASLPTHQRLPLADFFAPITRASIRVSAASLPEQLARAFAVAMGDPRGPVFMAFPAPETAKELDAAPPIQGAGDRGQGTGDRGTDRLTPDLAPVLAAIARAERPMIIAGLGVATGDAARPLVLLAERLGSPVADTPQMKGWFPNDHPLYLGTFGTHRDQVVTELANRSDLLLAIGLDSVEFLKPWRLTPPVISLATTGADEPAIPAEIAINGPLAQMLEVMAASNESRSRAKSSGVERSRAKSSEVENTKRVPGPAGAVERCRREILAGLIPPDPCPPSPVPCLWPQTVVSELQQAMPADGIVSVDVGSHKLLMVLQWIARRPNSFLNSSGISSMGTGIPFALAAKLAWPERPVAAVIGDGGFLMYTGQLEALARLDLPVLVVVMADASLYSIKTKQLQRQYPPVGTDFGAVPIAAIARDFGLHGVRVTSRAECARAMSEGLRAERATIIEAVIDPAGYRYSQ